MARGSRRSLVSSGGGQSQRSVDDGIAYDILKQWFNIKPDAEARSDTKVRTGTRVVSKLFHHAHVHFARLASDATLSNAFVILSRLWALGDPAASTPAPSLGQIIVDKPQRLWRRSNSSNQHAICGRREECVWCMRACCAYGWCGRGDLQRRNR